MRRMKWLRRNIARTPEVGALSREHRIVPALLVGCVAAFSSCAISDTANESAQTPETSLGEERFLSRPNAYEITSVDILFTVLCDKWFDVEAVGGDTLTSLITRYVDRISVSPNLPIPTVALIVDVVAKENGIQDIDKIYTGVTYRLPKICTIPDAEL